MTGMFFASAPDFRTSLEQPHFRGQVPKCCVLLTPSGRSGSLLSEALKVSVGQRKIGGM